MPNRQEESDYRTLAEQFSLDPADTKRIVQSFFSVILSDAKKLPFNNCRKIYSRQGFGSYSKIHGIPYLGRIGPIYSRYLKWRANEAKEIPTDKRSSYRSRRTQGEIEDIAAAILSGKTPTIPQKRKKSELFSNVWFVGVDGKKLARQVIKKEE